ncbi:MAG: carbon storage regulator CsrA [Leptospiraceae bacterium]|nr:carbon storage regulator CsrA [Leptospiraceae bacterium]
MLVLARKVNSSIMIGDDIEIVVVEIKGDQVKLGVKAPREISVHRSEVYADIQEQNRQAADSSLSDIANLGHLIKKKPGEKTGQNAD